MKKYGSISPKTIEQNEPTVDDGSNKKLQTEQDVALVNIDDKLRFYYKTTTSCTKQKSKIEKNKDRIACASIITEETRYDPYKIATILEDFTFMANALTYDPVCDFDDYNV
jgi:phage-related protein